MSSSHSSSALEGGSALEPALTQFDKRVLAALDPWLNLDQYADGVRPDFRNAWQVAERLGEYDVGAVRDTLRGLSHLGYAFSRDFGKRQQWVASRRAAEDLSS